MMGIFRRGASGAQLADQRPAWQLGALLIGAVAVPVVTAALAYSAVTRAVRTALPTPPTVLVTRGSVTSTTTTTGVTYAPTQAGLSFTAGAAAAGGVVRSVDVALGAPVRAGQALVTLDARSATRAVEQAATSLEAARITLGQQAAGAPADVATAAQVVAAASAAFQRAQNDRSTLQRGSGADAIAAASQAALTTQNALASAQEQLDVLEARGAALVRAEAIQRQMDAATAALNAAEADIERLLATTDSARFVRPAIDDFASAIEDRCKDLGNRDSCVDLAASAADLDTLSRQIVGGTGGLRDIEALRLALRRALDGASVAGLEGAVTRLAQALAMRPGLQARHDAAIFTFAPYGTPSAEDLLSAARARDAARQAATSAQERLRTLVAGPTTEERGNADQAVSAARAALDAALAAQAALGGGGTAVALQQQRVLLAESALRTAEDALADSVLRAPFDGVIARLDVRVGDAVTPYVPVVTVVDRTVMAVRLAASESEVGAIEPGHLGVARFDAMGGARYLVRVSGVAAVPRAQAGPATFDVEARVLTGGEVAAALASADALLPALGVSATASPAEREALVERLVSQSLPLSGLSASVTLAHRERGSVLLVPNSAIRRDAVRPAVEVLSPGGERETRRVAIGASDGRSTEIISGLTEGERVLERASASAP